MLVLVCLLSIFLFETKAQQSVELNYLRLAKKYIKFEISGFENDDNLDSKRQCCVDPNATVCTECSTVIRIIRHDNAGNTAFYTVANITNRSRALFYATRALAINPEEYVRYQVHQFEAFNLTHIDSWESFSTSWVGLYTMNGVWGLYANTLLFYSVEILVLNSFSSYYTVTFHITKVTWFKKEYADNTCCNPGNSSLCTNSCQFLMKIYANETLAHTSANSTFNGTNSTYYVKAASGSTSDVLRGDYLNLRFSIVGNLNNKLIDEVRIQSFRTMPNRANEFTNLIGSNGKLRLDLAIKYECRGYTGMNCKFFCDDNSQQIECNFLTGSKFCANGATNMPNCTTFSNTCSDNPCINGGVCVQLPSGFTCNCPRNYRGKFCEEPNCPSECKRGTCVDNKCVCDPGFEGDTCDATSCPSSFANLCKNGGVCKTIRGENKCVCGNYTTGPTCEDPVCPNPCQVGACAFVPGEKPLRAACACANGFTGDVCDIRPLKAVFGNDTTYIVLISIFATLLVILLKTFLVMLCVTFDVSKSQKGNIQESGETRPAPIAEM